ncbi:MAG: hypothetical protein ACR2ID_07880 [Chthoniobacterales bacterium]
MTATYRRRDSFALLRQRSTAAKTDHQFQATGSDFSGRCGGEGQPSFRRISDSYFAHEARGHFQIEALVFGVIALIAAVPVFEGVRGLFQFVYGVL